MSDLPPRLLYPYPLNVSSSTDSILQYDSKFENFCKEMQVIVMEEIANRMKSDGEPRIPIDFVQRAMEIKEEILNMINIKSRPLISRKQMFYVSKIKSCMRATNALNHLLIDEIRIAKRDRGYSKRSKEVNRLEEKTKWCDKQIAKVEKKYRFVNITRLDMSNVSTNYEKLHKLKATTVNLKEELERYKNLKPNVSEAGQQKLKASTVNLKEELNRYKNLKPNAAEGGQQKLKASTVNLKEELNRYKNLKPNAAEAGQQKLIGTAVIMQEELDRYKSPKPNVVEAGQQKLKGTTVILPEEFDRYKGPKPNVTETGQQKLKGTTVNLKEQLDRYKSPKHNVAEAGQQKLKGTTVNLKKRVDRYKSPKPNVAEASQQKLKGTTVDSKKKLNRYKRPKTNVAEAGQKLATIKEGQIWLGPNRMD